MSEFLEDIANGPSRSKQKDGQIWERPWTLEEMRQSSANWSLAADSGVSLFMNKNRGCYNQLFTLSLLIAVYSALLEKMNCTTEVVFCVFFFTALFVPPRLLPENAVKDP